MLAAGLLAAGCARVSEQPPPTPATPATPATTSDPMLAHDPVPITEGACAVTVILRDGKDEPTDATVALAKARAKTKAGRVDVSVPCGEWRSLMLMSPTVFFDRVSVIVFERRLEVVVRGIERGTPLAGERVSFAPAETRGARLSQLAELRMRAWGGSCATAKQLMSTSGASYSPDRVVAHAATLAAFEVCSGKVTAEQADRLLAEIDVTAAWIAHWAAGLAVALERASNEALRARARREVIDRGDVSAAASVLLREMRAAKLRGDQATLEALWKIVSTPRFERIYDSAATLRPDSVRLVPGEPLPALAGTTIDGRAFALETRKTRTLVYVWATWCERCLPALQRLAAFSLRATQGKPRIVTVAIDEERDVVKQWVGVHGPLPFPVVILDREQLAAFEHDFETVGMPACFLADAKGEVVSTGRDCIALFDDSPSAGFELFQRRGRR